MFSYERLLSLASIKDTSWAKSQLSLMQNDSLSYRTFFEKTVTLVRNQYQIIPLQNTEKQSIKVIHSAFLPKFRNRLLSYAPANFYFFDRFDWTNIQPNDLLLIVFDAHFGFEDLTTSQRNLLLQHQIKTVVINFENINNLLYLTDFQTIIQVYETNAVTEDWVSQLIFGGIQAKGQLPITIKNDFEKGQGDTSTPVIRLKYTLPEEVGMKSTRLQRIEQIVSRAIRKKAMPGGQVFVAKSGKVVYHQAFGHFTYAKERPVYHTDLYDLASITKIGATTLAAMNLYEQGQLDIDERLKYYLPEVKRSRMRYLKIRHILTHRSGLPSNPPISKYVRIEDTTSMAFQNYYSKNTSQPFTIKITEKQYFNEKVLAELWQEILNLQPSKRRKYAYSDVNFLLVQRIIEDIIEKSLDTYVSDKFYQKLGVYRLLFNPLIRFNKNEIAPTALDKNWRYTLLQGEVHDETAALLGGVSGTAGLFGSANDVGIIGQMLLNKGHYGGNYFFKPETVEYFTSGKHGGHRGLGFDRKTKTGAPGCYAGAGKGTFGHSGFTGTCIWIDPENELVFVFLSNRVHPDPKNQKLIKLKTRELVHREIYKALK